MTMTKNVKELGQFFTPKIVAEYMVGLSNVNKDKKILEPSCGEGVFVKCLEDKKFKDIDAYEVDNTLINISNTDIIYESFINQEIPYKYSLIIGNPPYIRWKNLKDELKDELTNNQLWNDYFNSLCDYLYIFILKSIELLEDNGELIFITPEYWMHTTHSIILRNYMIQNGYFEKIIHFNETPIFEGVNSSIIIFKFIKNKMINPNIELIEYQSNKKLNQDSINLIINKNENQSINYSTIPAFKKDKKWILATQSIIDELIIYENHCTSKGIHSNKEQDFLTMKDISDVGNGMVSGLDKIFQINLDFDILTEKEKKATIKVLKAKHLSSYFHDEHINYIFLEENLKEEDLISKYPNFYTQLKLEQLKLDKRYNYNRDIKYWEWVFLRNYKLFNSDREKIFIPCKERISHKDYFRFSYSEKEFFPTQDVAAIYLNRDVKESIFYILAILNNHRVFNWIKYNGIIKGNIVEFSEKPINSIPIRLIDWNNKEEVEIHNKITKLSKQYIYERNEALLIDINYVLDKLFI